MSKLSLNQRLVAGPSDLHGGWWIRAVVMTATSVDKSAGVLICGWGFDKEAPLRPWPTFHVERRTERQILAWVVWCGFFVGTQTSL